MKKPVQELPNDVEWELGQIHPSLVQVYKYGVESGEDALMVYNVVRNTPIEQAERVQDYVNDAFIEQRQTNTSEDWNKQFQIAKCRAYEIVTQDVVRVEVSFTPTEPEEQKEVLDLVIQWQGGPQYYKPVEEFTHPRLHRGNSGKRTISLRGYPDGKAALRLWGEIKGLQVRLASGLYEPQWDKQRKWWEIQLSPKELRTILNYRPC